MQIFSVSCSSPFDGDDERLAVGALQDFRLAERPVRLAVQHLEQPRHVLLHAGVRAGEDVAMAVAVDVHKLWSGADVHHHTPGTSATLPSACSQSPAANFALAQVLEDPDLSLVELPDEQVLLAVAVDVGPAGRRVAGALDADRGRRPPSGAPGARNLVTDNGSSFLARHFRRHIEGQYAHVRIHYRTPTQLGLLERFHQTLKTEEVYWKLYSNPGEARASLEVFRQRYNDLRPHWALVPSGQRDPLTPADVYVHGRAVELPKWQGWAKAAREKLKKMTEGAPRGVAPAAEAVA